MCPVCLAGGSASKFRAVQAAELWFGSFYVRSQHMRSFVVVETDDGLTVAEVDEREFAGGGGGAFWRRTGGSHRLL